MNLVFKVYALLFTMGLHLIICQFGIPFLDSLTSGYCFYTWSDIFIRQTPQGPIITSSNKREELIEIQQRPDPGLPALNGFDKFLLTWTSHWGIKTPKGEP